MHLEMFDDCQMDSRRALWLSRARTLVLSDFFFGLGAGRRRTLEKTLKKNSTESLENKIIYQEARNKSCTKKIRNN